MLDRFLVWLTNLLPEDAAALLFFIVMVIVAWLYMEIEEKDNV